MGDGRDQSTHRAARPAVGAQADTHQGCHTRDPHGQGVALLQRLRCGLEGVSREGVGQGPNPAHEALLGLERLLGLLMPWSRGWMEVLEGKGKQIREGLEEARPCPGWRAAVLAPPQVPWGFWQLTPPTYK